MSDPPSLAGLPDGAAVRRWARRQSRKEPVGTWKILDRIYTALISVLVGGALVAHQLSTLSALGERRRLDLSLDPAWMAVSVVAAVAVCAIRPLMRLGPVCLRPHEATWWLALPVERVGLLRPVALVLIALAACAGALIGLVVSALGAAGWAGALAWGAAMAAGAALLVVALIGAQVEGRTRRAPELVTASAAGLALVGAVALPFPTSMVAHAVTGAVGAAMALAAVASWRRHGPRLGEVHDAVLVEASLRAHSARISSQSLDTRALGRLLSPEPRRPGRPSRLPLAAVGAVLPRPFAVALAVAQADLLVLVRQPQRWWRLALSAIIALGLQLVPGAGALAMAGAHVVGVWLAVLTVAEPARRAWFDPGPEEQLPGGSTTLSAGHLLVPTALMSAWSLVVALPQLLGPSDAGTGLVLATVILAGLGWGGAALRAGMRPMPDFFEPPMPSPVGPVAPWLGQAVVAGYDAAVLCAAPTALLAAGVTPSWLLLGLQVVLTALVIAWGMSDGSLER